MSRHPSQIVPEIAREQQSSNTALHDLLKQQNEITAMLVEQQNRACLPKREIQIFSGRMQDYRSFITAFEHNIVSLTSSYRDKLYYLWQYTSGRPKEIVKGCMGRDPEIGFKEALRELEDEYGDDYRIATAYREDIEKLKPIKGEDKQAYKNLLTFIITYNNAMKENSTMRNMDQTFTIQSILKKLPYKIRDKWRSRAYSIRENKKTLATFQDFVHFMKQQVDKITDSVYGDIADDHVKRNDNQGRNQGKNRRSERSSFGTVVKNENKKAEGNASASEPLTVKCAFEEPCLYCESDHTMEHCEKLRGQPHEERMKFLRTKGLCFRCLYRKHMSKDCKREKLTCQVCKQKHPTVLHTPKKQNDDAPKDQDGGNETKKEEKAPKAKSHYVNATEKGICGRTGAGSSKGALPVVPVQVKMKNSDKFIQTYAFLDNGSTDTFCTERLAKQLNANSRKTKIMLCTLGQNELVDSCIVKDLEICDLEGNNTIELPKVYTQQTMPLTKDDIPKQEDIRDWTYLSEVCLPEIDADVELLIGNNVPKAAEPWQVINSQSKGPYAVRTQLGWVVNGLMDGHNSKSRVSVNRINVGLVAELEQQLTDYFNLDFSERIAVDKPELSREDHQFMEKVEKSVKMKDGHYEIGLPFKDESIELPNNRTVAEQLASSLQRKFIKNSDFCEDYKAFMENIIEKGYAQKVPRADLSRNDGRVWYIPHHGVYHPRKNKIRVVINCRPSTREYH